MSRLPAVPLLVAISERLSLLPTARSDPEQPFSVYGRPGDSKNEEALCAGLAEFQEFVSVGRTFRGRARV